MKQKRWFSEARFGAFIHWGLYALPGGVWKGETMEYIGEWLQARFRIPNAEYAALAEQFNPTAFDAEEIVRRMGHDYSSLSKLFSWSSLGILRGGVAETGHAKCDGR